MLETDPADADHLHEECGVFGVYGHPEAAALAALGLHALQHRGQEAAGIVAYDGEQFSAHRGMGQVSDNFSSKEVIARLRGPATIGHVRYATTGEVALRNVQPLFADFEFGGLAICHNGNLTNSYQLRRRLVHRGSLFQSTSDTEVIVHLIATSLKETRRRPAGRRIASGRGRVFVGRLVTGRGHRRARPAGVRPLVLGRLGDAWILASETCALDIIGAEFVRDVDPGEIVIIGAGGVESLMPFGSARQRFCVFEYIYFARPDSVVEGSSVYEARKRIGRELARESHVDADIVVPVPDFGRASGARLCSGIRGCRSSSASSATITSAAPSSSRPSRSAISGCGSSTTPTEPISKASASSSSTIRSSAAPPRSRSSRWSGSAGAREVHMRISSPPTTLFLLLRHRHAGARSVARGALRCRGRWPNTSASTASPSCRSTGSTGRWASPGRDPLAPRFCDACFTGDYPIPPTDADDGKVSVQLSLLAEPA